MDPLAIAKLCSARDRTENAIDKTQKSARECHAEKYILKIVMTTGIGK